MNDVADSRERPTVELDPLDLLGAGPSWRLTAAVLERHGSWAIQAFRLGMIALLQRTLREMAEPNASAELVMQAREYIEALAHMTWEP